jgi:hypothetical protein
VGQAAGNHLARRRTSYPTPGGRASPFLRVAAAGQSKEEAPATGPGLQIVSRRGDRGVGSQLTPLRGGVLASPDCERAATH